MTTHQPDGGTPEQDMLQRLRGILLEADRKEIEAIKATLYEEEKLAERVNPILEKRIERIKSNFEQELGTQVNQRIEIKLEASKEQLLNVIYPVLGQMIRKFVTYQFQLLKDSIDAQLNQVFSSRGLLGQLRSRLFGIKSSDMVLRDLDKPMIQEVYVIQRDSELLLGSYSREQMIDKDMVAGMLTAIKSFVEDAFQREKEELERIEYGNYIILIQNFFSYYIAVALTGSLSSSERAHIVEHLAAFASEYMGDQSMENVTDTLNQSISSALEAHFTDFTMA